VMAAPRLKAVIFILVLQIAALGAAIVWLMIRFPVVSYLGVLISAAVVLVILKKDKPSAYKLTWIILVLALPMVGGGLYLLFGDKRPTKKIAAYMDEHALISKYLDKDENIPDLSLVGCGRMSGLFQYIRRVSSYHAYMNTAVKYYSFGEYMFEDMLAALSAAKSFIFLEYFIINKSSMWDEILEILEGKVKEGVDVRLIVDDLGSMELFTDAYVSRLTAQGIKIIKFNPMRPFLLLFMNNRDHRKIMVIDGHTAFSGGINIADEYINRNKRLGVWKDTGLRLKGEAAWSFTLMFIEMWDTFCKKEERINDYASYKCPAGEAAATDGFVLPYGDSPLDREQLGEDIYIDLLKQAERYVYIFTPYLIISERMVYALQMAAKRGIDVRIVTPGIPDKKIIYRLTRANYWYLLKAGVRIYEYTPGFMHAKSFVSDDKIAIIGTINLDYRSLYLHFECAALLYNSGVIKDIKADAQASIEKSREVKLSKGKRGISAEFVEAVLHLFSPLL
jgi:cardiolipin synthase